MKPAQTPKSRHLLWILLILTFSLGAAELPRQAAAASQVTARRQQSSPATSAPALPTASAFTLTDTDGKTQRLTEFRGQPIALFFFCGCPWCQRCAETWSQFQRGGALPASLSKTPKGLSPGVPMTLVVFSGDASGARAFATQTGLDSSQILLLLDPDLRVTTAYHADPCPRAFVLDAKGRIRYTNDHADDAARKAPALAIASHVLDALRAACAPDEAKDATVQPTSTLPVTAIDGSSLNLAARPGWKVVYFWSSVCPCVRACESFTLVPLAQRYKGQVSFYAIASNGYDLKLPHSQLLHQIQSHRLPFPVLLDSKHFAAETLNAKITPQAFLLDLQNRVVFAGIPDDSRRYQARTGKWGVSKSYLSEAIAQALAGQSVTVPAVKVQGCIIAW